MIESETTQIETFLCDEIQNEHIEVAEEAVKLIEELGLEGQKNFINPDTKQRSPFRVMSTDERFTYEVLCPEQVNTEQFSGEAIPFRVLEVLKRATETGQFKCFRIWSDSIGDDPILVAHESGYYDGKPFILARWGKHLEALPELHKKAMAIQHEKYMEKLKSIVSESTAALSSGVIPGEKLSNSTTGVPELPSFYL